MTDMPCGLCGNTQHDAYFKDKRRPYLQCTRCQLVFVPKSHHVDANTEKAIYDQHQNDLLDEGYRRFLMRALDPVIARVDKGATGLEFGCGPGPLLAKMLNEAGYHVNLYDLYYHPHNDVLKLSYDFITCTEVIEHVAEPKHVFEHLLSMLKTGAPLVLMTKLVLGPERFATWHYKNDLTHISYFSRATFEFVARQFNVAIEFIGSDVIVLTK
jgi:cyclopropane fatty-acyl-phospholipid synthase-like methyltransferase